MSPQDLEDRVFTQVSHGHEDDDDDDGDDDDDDEDADSARRPGPCCSSAGCPRSPWCLSSSARRGPPSSPGTLSNLALARSRNLYPRCLTVLPYFYRKKGESLRQVEKFFLCVRAMMSMHLRSMCIKTLEDFISYMRTYMVRGRCFILLS